MERMEVRRYFFIRQKGNREVLGKASQTIGIDKERNNRKANNKQVRSESQSNIFILKIGLKILFQGCSYSIFTRITWIIVICNYLFNQTLISILFPQNMWLLKTPWNGTQKWTYIGKANDKEVSTSYSPIFSFIKNPKTDPMWVVIKFS